MKVLFDYQAFEMQDFGGVSKLYGKTIPLLCRYSVEPIVGIKESNNVYLHEIGLKSEIKPLNYSNQRLFGAPHIIPGQRKTLHGILKLCGKKDGMLTPNRDLCIKLLKNRDFDIFEPTFYDDYFIEYLKGKPFTLEIHDMIPELFPQYFGTNDSQIKQKRILCSRAAAIHVPSNSTKEDLVNILDIQPEKITIISRGAPSILTQPNSEVSTNLHPYILFVGDRRDYKNFKPLLHEISIIIQKEPDIQLVCTGRPFCSEEIRLMNDLKITSHIHHTYANERNLPSLYNNAVAFVYPSAYEGFGLLILEAFSYRCPAMLNNASCFPEIAGNAALFFDINRQGDFADHFVDFYRTPQQARDELIQRGLQQVQLYSWEKTTNRLAQLYHSLS